jgi:hypothetical protein
LKEALVELTLGKKALQSVSVHRTNHRWVLPGLDVLRTYDTMVDLKYHVLELARRKCHCCIPWHNHDHFRTQWSVTR